MRNVKLVLEYDGTGLAGWQRQENGPTVQAALEAALAAMTGAPVPVRGASRTDAGVHALGQVANFKTESAIPLHGFRRGLNAHLPPAIAVVDAAEVPLDFDARRSAVGKRYRYTLLMRPDRSPLLRDRAWHVSRPLDLAAMREAAGQLLGEHDFSAFRAAGCSSKHGFRRIDRIELLADPAGAGCIEVHVAGNAFLRHMVRILVGTLVYVGHGRLTPAQVGEILRGRDRTRAGITAPPGGLTLLEVRYPIALMTQSVIV